MFLCFHYWWMLDILAFRSTWKSVQYTWKQKFVWRKSARQSVSGLLLQGLAKNYYFDKLKGCSSLMKSNKNWIYLINLMLSDILYKIMKQKIKKNNFAKVWTANLHKSRWAWYFETDFWIILCFTLVFWMRPIQGQGVFLVAF